MRQKFFAPPDLPPDHLEEGLGPPPETWDEIPEPLRRTALTALNGEFPICWVETDLDERMHYAHGLLLLTSKRLVNVDSKGTVQSFPLSSKQRLESRDLIGTGILELVDDAKQLAAWRHTGARRTSAHRLRTKYDQILAGKEELDEDLGPFAAVCTECGRPLNPDQVLCPQCEAAKSKQAFRSLLRLFRFARPRLSIIVIGLTLQILSTAASLIPPYLTIPMIDDVLIPYHAGSEIPIRLIQFYILGLFGAQVLSWLLGWARTWVLAWVSERIAADLRTTTYSHLQSLSLEYFGGRRTGDLISRVSSDSDRICYFLSVHLLDFGSDVLMILMTAGILVYIDPLLALVTLVPLPLIGYLVHKVRRRLVEGFTQGSRAWADMTSVLADTIPGIRVVKAFAQEQREIGRFRHVNELVLQANDRVNSLWSFFSSIVSFLTGIGVIIVWGFGAWLVFHSGVKVGVLTGFVQYISRFYGRMDSMSRMVSAFQRAGVASQRVFSILDRVPGVPDPVSPIHPGRLKGKIELKNVSFHYGPRQVMRGVNLEINPGEMIGLVGPSGAGKSTLINLICRFYDVHEGAVLVDGHDIRSYPAEEYRKNIGIVLQEPFLFYGTIADNISYGKPKAKRTELLNAARAARAHDFILALPDGYDSMVGERGQALSGGERQRVSIARALLIDPAILVLDEATSSVDSTTEVEIQRALENLVKGRTTIAIAHRLTTLHRADRIVVMDHGKISRITTPADFIPSSTPPPNDSPILLDSSVISSMTFERNAFGRLNLVLPGRETIPDVVPVRAFPLTSPEEWISILDNRGKEILSIDHIDRLSHGIRPIIEDELSHREFVPVIKRITNADTDSVPLEWHVETDRGSTVFYMESDDDMRRLSDTSAIFTDTHGIRYLIRDFHALDSGSRRILNKFF